MESTRSLLPSPTQQGHFVDAMMALARVSIATSLLPHLSGFVSLSYSLAVPSIKMSPKRKAEPLEKSPAKTKKQKTMSSFFSSRGARAASETSDAEISRDGFKIFCDLDGVLCDFDAGVKELFNGRGPDEVPNRGTMWGAIHNNDGFYENLPWTNDGKRLWNAIRDHTPDILTGVPMSKHARADKAAWCARELGVATNHVDLAAPKRGHDVVQGRRKDGVVNIITCWSRNKHLESGQGIVLIDDRESLSTKWEEAGGIFVHHTDTVTTLDKLRQHGILNEKEEEDREEQKEAYPRSPSKSSSYDVPIDTP